MLKMQHHIVAPIPENIAANAAALINQIRYDGLTKARREALFELIMAMTESGIDFFFLEPLRRLNASPMLLGIARMGLNSTLAGTRMVIHKVLKKLEDAHVEHLLVFIEEILFAPETHPLPA